MKPARAVALRSRRGGHPWKLSAASACTTLAMSLLVPACWVAGQWVERQGQRILDQMSRRDQFDNWNL
jgi:hypothetical protein